MMAAEAYDEPADEGPVPDDSRGVAGRCAPRRAGRVAADRQPRLPRVMAAFAAVEVVSWPVATALAIGHVLARDHDHPMLREVGVGLETA